MYLIIFFLGNIYIYIIGIFIVILMMLGRVNFKEFVMFKIVYYILYDMIILFILSKKLMNIFFVIIL